jgi:hypothetical protein
MNKAILDKEIATVDLIWSNIGNEWIASLITIDDSKTIESTGKTRAEALRNLADDIEWENS